MTTDKELLEEASRERGLNIKLKDEGFNQAVELQRLRMLRLEEYNAPVYVYRITKKGKEYLKEKEQAIG